jgi:hypothetical protein
MVFCTRNCVITLHTAVCSGDLVLVDHCHKARKGLQDLIVYNLLIEGAPHIAPGVSLLALFAFPVSRPPPSPTLQPPITLSDAKCGLVQGFYRGVPLT